MSRIAWDGYVEQDGMDYVTLPEGDYDFTVTSVERGMYSGSDKIDACDMVTLELTIDQKGVGRSVVKENIYLDTSVEWKISAFLRSIGKKKHGERAQMNWLSYQNLKGRAHLVVNTYIGQDGKTRTNNKVQKFLDPQPVETTNAEGDSEGKLPFEI